MARWEYTFITGSNGSRGILALMGRLRDMGDQGWEIFKITRIGNYDVILFKRKKKKNK